MVDQAYRHGLEFAAGCVLVSILWAGYAAVIWRPWMR